jgi:hypothetical protein
MDYEKEPPAQLFLRFIGNKKKLASTLLYLGLTLYGISPGHEPAISPSVGSREVSILKNGLSHNDVQRKCTDCGDFPTISQALKLYQMKNFSPLFRLIPLLSVVLTVASSQATILVDESFGYADGALAGQNGGTGFSAAWTGGSYNITSGVAIGSGNAFRSLSSTDFFATYTDMWIGFDYGRNPGNYTGFSLFNSSNAEQFFIGSSSGDFGGDVWGMVKYSPSPKSSQGSTVSSYLSAGGMKRGVIHLTRADLTSSWTATLWVGNVNGTTVDIGGTPAATLSGFDLTNISQIRIGSGSAGAQFDAIQFATTALEVGAVPEPSTLAFLAVALGGAFMIRRRTALN